MATTINHHTTTTTDVQIGDLVRTNDGTEIEVTATTRPSLFGNGWMISGHKIVNGVPQRGDFLHQIDTDTVSVWR